MLKHFNWVKIWQFGRSLPPIYPVVLHEAAGKMACVLRVIVLLKAMTVGESGSDEWKQPVAEDLGDVKLRVHDSFVHHQFCWPSLRDSGPHVHFDRMFKSAFKLWLLVL